MIGSSIGFRSGDWHGAEFKIALGALSVVISSITGEISIAGCVDDHSVKVSA